VSEFVVTVSILATRSAAETGFNSTSRVLPAVAPVSPA
jgi:hypothetical protein